MGKLKNNVKRLCIYFFYEQDGIVDEYVLDCLRQLSEHVEKTVFVSNSKLTPESLKSLKALSSVQVEQRSNEGFDVWAYKHGINKVGWKKLETFDEVIFMNFTIVGPIYPLSEMFDEMDSRNIDFWGINVHAGEKFDPWGIMPEGYIPRHLQSHFLAVRSEMLKSEIFQNYWDSMRPIVSYQQAIGYHEAIFTKTFSDAGFKWSSYVDTQYLEKLVSYPLMFMPREVIINQRAPFFKRKALFLPTTEYMGVTSGMPAAETVDCVQEIGYDLSKVIPNITRSANQYDIRQALNAVSIFDSTTPVGKIMPKDSIAFSAFLTDKLHSFALEMYLPAIINSVGEVDLIVFGKESDAIEQQLEKFSRYGVKIIRGDFSTFLDSVNKLSQTTEVVGTAIFSDPVGSEKGLSELEYVRYGLEALFQSKQLIDKSVNELINNPVYGAFVAPRAVHNGYDKRWTYWEQLYKRVKTFMDAIGSRVSVDVKYPPLESPNGVYLIRSDVLRELPWKKIKGLLASLSTKVAQNVFALSIPYLVQHRGLVAAYGMSDKVARNNMVIMEYKRLNLTVNVDDIPQARKQKDSLEPGIVYIGVDEGFSENSKLEVNPSHVGEAKRITYTFNITKSSNSIRFDPVNNKGVVCSGVRALINGSKVPITPLNASVQNEKGDLFVTDDPQYIIHHKINKGDEVSISFDSLEPFTYLDFVPAPSSKSVHEFGGPVGAFLQKTSEGRISRYKRKLW
ncbi:MAG: rhamnan synthesis F family protein [Patescibacteria group bacterium]